MVPPTNKQTDTQKKTLRVEWKPLVHLHFFLCWYQWYLVSLFSQKHPTTNNTTKHKTVLFYKNFTAPQTFLLTFLLFFSFLMLFLLLVHDILFHSIPSSFLYSTSLQLVLHLHIFLCVENKHTKICKNIYTFHVLKEPEIKREG